MKKIFQIERIQIYRISHLLVFITISIIDFNFLSNFSLQSLRRIKYEDYKIRLQQAYQGIWKKTTSQESFDTSSMEEIKEFFEFDEEGIQIVPRGEGATLVVMLPQDVQEKLHNIMFNLKTDLAKVIPDLDKKLYLSEPDTYHITIQSIWKLRREPMPDFVLSQDNIEKMKSIVESFPVFKFQIKNINLTPGGVIIAEGYVDTAVPFDIRKELRSAFDFLPLKKRRFEILHITLGRFLEQIAPQEYRKLIEVIQNYRNFKIGEFEVKDLLLAHIRTYGLEKRFREDDKKFLLGSALTF